jgi:hypothetical protein
MRFVAHASVSMATLINQLVRKQHGGDTDVIQQQT